MMGRDGRIARGGPYDSAHFEQNGVENVRIDGESGRDARVCDYDWVLYMRKQCEKAGISFVFGGTGSHFRKDGTVQNINPYQQKNVAREMDINIE